MSDGKPVLGWDYDLERWSDGSYDERGKLVWHDHYPHNDEWESVRKVTLNFDPGGEGDFRNYEIPPQRPLDVYGIPEPGNEDIHYDLDDLALKAFLDYGFEF